MNRLFANIDKGQVARYALLSLIVAISAVLQNAFGLMNSNGNFRIYIVVAVVISIATLESEVPSTLFGIFGGLCLDVFSPVHMGYNAVILAIMCLFTSLAVSHFLRSTIFTNILFAGIALAGYVTLYWLFFVVFGGIENGFKTLFSIYLPNAIGSWIVSPFVYIIIRAIRKAFVEKTNHISF